MADKKEIIEKLLDREDGILRLNPAWVARDFLPPGKRLGLKEEEYDVGERGFICERWLASVTKADNRVGPIDEGLGYIQTEGDEEITLKEAVELLPERIMGADYAKTHTGLGRLAKVYDFGARIPYHIHQMEKDARLVGRNSKDEAYYFLDDVDPGPHPETFFGVHPYIADEKKYDLLLPYLEDWDSDRILQHSRAYLNVPGEGFFLPSGVLHAPGTALTLELQEDSDVFAMLQALNAGKIISKELLFKDVDPEQRKNYGERIILNQIDWETCGDPYFYENHHLKPLLIEETEQEGGKEYWIYYNSRKFSGKKVVVRPGQTFQSRDNGVYSVFVWKGEGAVGGHEIEAGNHTLDELLVSHETSVKPLVIQNTGPEELMLIKFFGPDINKDVPMINKRG